MINVESTPGGRKKASDEGSTPQGSAARTPHAYTPSGTSRAKTSLADMMSSTTPNHKQKLLPKNITPSQKVSFDWVISGQVL